MMTYMAAPALWRFTRNDQLQTGGVRQYIASRLIRLFTVAFVSLRRYPLSRSVFYAVLTILCAFAISQAQESLTKARTRYFPDTTNNIHLEMVFNYNVTDINTESGVVDMVWASDYPDQPAGVYNTVYIPYSVDNFTNSVAWYQQHHPDWLEYHCDRKTLCV